MSSNIWEQVKSNTWSSRHTGSKNETRKVASSWDESHDLNVDLICSLVIVWNQSGSSNLSQEMFVFSFVRSVRCSLLVMRRTTIFPIHFFSGYEYSTRRSVFFSFLDHSHYLFEFVTEELRISAEVSTTEWNLFRRDDCRRHCILIIVFDILRSCMSCRTLVSRHVLPSRMRQSLENPHPQTIFIPWSLCLALQSGFCLLTHVFDGRSLARQVDMRRQWSSRSLLLNSLILIIKQYSYQEERPLLHLEFWETMKVTCAWLELLWWHGQVIVQNIMVNWWT